MVELFPMRSGIGPVVKHRTKTNLSLAQFLEKTSSGEKFALEFFNNGTTDHVIDTVIRKAADINAALPELLTLLSARNSVVHVVRLNNMIAMRLGNRRYNWNNDLQQFVEE